MNRNATLAIITLFASITVFFAATANAAIVSVTVTGQVVFNGIGAAPLSGVSFGDNVVMSFTVDSDNFVDGIPGDTRGYVIDQSSFSLSFDTPVSLGMLSPFPGTPYFTLIDGFPVADGFFVATSPVSPGGVPLEQAPYQVNLDLGYQGDTLASLDILDAVGVYDFTGLTRFGFSLWSITPDFPEMEIDFQQMTIQAVPIPAGVWLFGSALAGAGFLRRRRKSA